MKPSNGPLPAHRQTFHVVLAPLQSYAFVPKEIAVVPSERATLSFDHRGPGVAQPRAIEGIPSRDVTLTVTLD